MITYLSIRDTLQTALADDLGTYTSKAGDETPAITIISPTSKQVEDWASVEGLEVIIVQSPQIPLQRILGNTWLATYSGTVYLSQRTKGGALLRPAEKAIVALGQIMNLQVQSATGTPANERIDAIASVSIPFQFTGHLTE